jgi:hypothetical protein
MSVNVSQASVVPGGNIGNFFSGGGGGMALWRLTAIINGGTRGKTTSVIWNGVDDINVASAKAIEWATQLAWTLGNAGAEEASVKGPTAASPRITYVRVVDAKLPRRGILLATDGNSNSFNGPGTGAGNNSHADFISTAMAIRLAGRTTESTVQFGYSNHALLGVPDKAVINGDQVFLGAAVGTAPGTYSFFVNQYLTWLMSPGNGLGFMMVPFDEPKKPARNFAYVDGVWQMKVVAHAYFTNDRLWLTGANAPGFNGSYKITKIDVDTIAITNGPPSGVAIPTRADVRRYQLANGVRLGAFAQFEFLPGQNVPPFGLKVSKRNPARVFTGVSFRKKTRKLH